MSEDASNSSSYAFSKAPAGGATPASLHQLGLSIIISKI